MIGPGSSALYYPRTFWKGHGRHLMAETSKKIIQNYNPYLRYTATFQFNFHFFHLCWIFSWDEREAMEALPFPQKWLFAPTFSLNKRTRWKTKTWREISLTKILMKTNWAYGEATSSLWIFSVLENWFKKFLGVHPTPLQNTGHVMVLFISHHSLHFIPFIHFISSFVFLSISTLSVPMFVFVLSFLWTFSIHFNP